MGRISPRRTVRLFAFAYRASLDTNL